MNRHYYFAYGSNLNLHQMAVRCPEANPIGSAVLKGYELLFCGTNGSAVATIERRQACQDYSVIGGLWRITLRDETLLDIYEGFPRLYRKETVTVQFYDHSVEAMVYVMNEGYPVALPSSTYLCTILEGYESFGLDTRVLERALGKRNARTNTGNA